MNTAIIDLNGTAFADAAKELRASRWERAKELCDADPTLTMAKAIARVERFDDEGC